MLAPDLERSKIRFTVFTYDPATSKSGVQVSAYMDELTARAVATLLLSHRLNPTYTEFKGSSRNGTVESRVFKLIRHENGPKPYLVSITRGAGALLPTGAVKPVPNSPSNEASFMLDEFEITKMALAILEAIRAFWATHYPALHITRGFRPAAPQAAPATTATES